MGVVRTARRKRMAGDTLVEVLICVLLVSIILGGAYTTVRRSSVGIRNSQEQAEVLKAVQGQIEQLRSSASGNSDAIFTAATPFCMVDGAPVSSNVQPNAAKCVQDAAGRPSTGQPSYRLTVNREPSGTGTLFTVRADWDAVTGTQAQQTMYYRMQR